MRSLLNIVEARPEHAIQVAAGIRPEDAAEVWAIAMKTPLAAAEQCLERSLRSWAWVEDGQALVIFGVGGESLIGGVGRPWQLTRTEVTQRRTRFCRVSLNALERMREVRPRLENWVDARYGACVRYLRWLGFTVHQAEPMGILGLPFHRFEIGVP